MNLTDLKLVESPDASRRGSSTRLRVGTKIVLIFFVTGIALYANTFNNRMFWDDDDIILENRYVQEFQISKFFKENQIAGANLVSNYWRPLMLTVFGIEWRLWGDSPAGYHMVNTAFHVTNAILLFYILQYLFKNRWLSFLTSLVFLVHPLQTEAVTYVSGLADPLSTFFIFLGILFYFRFRDTPKVDDRTKWKYFALAMSMYLLAFLSKDTAVIMPAMLAITDFFYLPQGLSIKNKLIKVTKSIWPFFAVAALYFILRATALNFQNTFNVYGEENVITENFGVRLMIFFRAMSVYAQLLFWPNNLHMERGFEIPHSIFQPDVLFGGLLTALMLFAGFSTIKKYPVISFGIFWFFARLFPNSNLLIPNAGLVYEHWMYVPMIGIFLIVIWMLLKLSERLELNSEYDFKKIFAGIFAIYLMIFGYKTIARNNDWQDPVRFYEQTLHYSPSSYRIVNNLAMSYAQIGNHDKAIEFYNRAITLDDRVAVAYHNLGNSYRDTGNKTLAVENYEKALSLQPDFLFSYNALAQLYLDEKNYSQVIEIMERLKSANPGQAEYANQVIEQIKRLKN